jgi:hypothetical protein
MDASWIRTRIEQATAALRASYPDMTDVHTVFSHRLEAGRPRYSLYLDLHWPQRQLLVPGPSREEPGAAIDAAIQEARARIDQATWASR